MTNKGEGMKQLTDEQYEQIGCAALKWAAQMRGLMENTNIPLVGRAAYEAAYPLAVVDALAELSNEEKAYVWGEFVALENIGMYDRDSMLFKVIDRLISRRSAALTAKPDPAVEAVKAVLDEFRSDSGIGFGELMRSVNESIVAAVRAADKKAGRA